MTNTFLQELEKGTSVKRTENMAVAYSTSLDAVVDLFAMGGAYRSRPAADVFALFGHAYTQDPVLATKALFYIRDVRGGQGERRFFRTAAPHIFNALAPEKRMRFLDLIETYGRLDDMLCLYDEGDGEVAAWIKNRFWEDYRATERGKPLSLLAKWLPSENTSSKDTVLMARKVIVGLGMTANEYRRRLSTMRRHLKVVERDMSAKRWEHIAYPAVPSQAMMKYKNAFLKHDGERFTEYKKSVVRGETKINTGTLYPYQIFERVLAERWADDTCDLLWDNLPDYVPKGQKAIVVADTSGSMVNGSPSPMSVALSLALYFAQRNVGPFANVFITFSDNPRFQKIPIIGSLYDKIRAMDTYDWAMNTDIDRVFDLLLRTALSGNVKPEDVPGTVFIVSDMEFDQCTENADVSNFEAAKMEWEKHDLKLPNIVFWNVSARNDTLPVRYNEQGVALVSGASPSIFRQAVEQTTPVEFMLSVLSGERYDAVGELFSK